MLLKQIVHDYYFIIFITIIIVIAVVYSDSRAIRLLFYNSEIHTLHPTCTYT